MSNEIADITKSILEFRDARDWKQFHNLKDLALAISIEAAELNELFLWKKWEEADTKKIEEELADLYIYALLLAHEANIDVADAVRRKLKRNEVNYPVEKSLGNARKYTDLK